MPEIAGIVAGLVILALLFKPFFGDADGFMECVRYWFRPDILSLFSGDYHRDRIAELKLGAWLLLGGAGGFAAFTAVAKMFGA